MAELEQIILEIENQQMQCVKSILTNNSDYFKAMFEGDFVERDQSVIKLKDVKFYPFNIILILLADDGITIGEENLLPVLQTACMLQFERIRLICIERLTEILSVENCLKVWHVCESLDIKPLYLKAKNLCLIEFNSIKHTDCLLELTMKQLYVYLANVFLCVNNELDVFTTCMWWWYENSIKEEFTTNIIDASELLYYFLTVLDFNALSNNDINSILTYPDIAGNKKIVNILSNILKIRNYEDFEENADISKINILLNCRRRIKNYHPCILIDVYSAPCDTGNSGDHVIPSRKNHSTRNKNVLLFNTANSNFTKILTILPEKHKDLQGFHILGYKELIFLFGGEICWGRGNWSDNFWVYDTIRERWERKTKMPYGRRHFESCIADDIVYIVGGTGNYRVLQDDMFWYNYKYDTWSKTIALPCKGRQIKCCEYKKQLLLLSVNNKCGYLFNTLINNWAELKILDRNGLVNSFPEQYLVFSFKDFIYIKGSSIITLAIVENHLEILSTRFLKPINHEMIDSHVCGGYVYTIYKNVSDTGYSSYTFEKFDIENYIEEVVFDISVNNFEESTGIELCGEVCKFSETTKLFRFSHYSMMEEDTYLTDVLL